VQGQGRQLIGREWLVPPARRQESQGAQSPAAGGSTRLAGHVDPLRITDSDGIDVPGPIDQDTHAAVERGRECGHLAGQVLGQDGLRRDAPTLETFELMALGGRKP
jgi:hypothetical protein